MSKLAVLSTVSLLAVLVAAESRAQTAITTPILSSVNNFRDLAGIAATVNGVATGGTGFADTTTNDGVMRTGVFYRSNALSSLSAADSATITSLGVTQDIDLRTPYETSSAPNIIPTGVNYVNVNIFNTYAPAAPTAYTAAGGVAYLEAANQSFVTDPAQRANIATTLLDLANSNGASMYNCSSGKDRTGWISAVLQSIAGVSSTQIMTDYLATNVYSAKSIAASVNGAGGPNSALGQFYGAILGVQASDLQAGLDQVTASYGSMQNYLTQGLGLSQADIYVLRAKMVYYNSLPGQTGFTGNAASGALLLQFLQNSPLSGNYTTFNYYLQSAIDAGTLGGVQQQVGGQVHADTAAYFLQQPRRIENAVAANALGADLAIGKLALWQVDLGEFQNIHANNGAAASDDHSAGFLLGGTYRATHNASLFAGVGYNWGSVSSAGATTAANDFVLTLGGRYGLTDLDKGYFLNAKAVFGAIDDRSNRTFNQGLGTATGSSAGTLASGRVDLGYALVDGPLRYTPEIGVRVANVNIGAFAESGSELALAMNDTSKTLASLVTGFDVSARALEAGGGWKFSPEATVAWEHALNAPGVTTTGSLYGLSVSQASALNARDLFSLDLGVSVKYRENISFAASLNAVADSGANSGIGGKLSAQYSF